MNSRYAALALLVGNFVIGLSILAPAGMIEPLATGLDVSIGRAAFLVTGGAVILCIGSPLVAWATNALDRRVLLAGTLALLALCHAASALAPGYDALFGLRLVSMAVAAIFTPQAASTIALMAAEKDRPSAISFVFLGWSLSVAFGLPLVAWFAGHFDWRPVYGALALGAASCAVFVVLTVPRGLRGAPMSFASWGTLLRMRLVILLLAATIISSCGQFIIFTYFGPLLSRLVAATPTEIAICFAVFGVSGFLGNVFASRIVGRAGAFGTSMFFFAAMLAGSLIWSAGAGFLLVMGVGAAIWGFGFAASNSMQQARLAVAAPALAGAAIALNSSSLYIGQAIGSAIGGVMFENGLFVAMGYVTAAFLALTFAVIALTGPRVKLAGASG